MKQVSVWGAVICAVTSVGAAHGAVLYDGTIGTTPGAQGWTYLPLGATQTAPTLPGSPFTTFDSLSAFSVRGGYSQTAPVALDRTTGYRLDWTFRVASESHNVPPATNGNNRAGVSLIAVGSDLQGIEVAFWENEVWVQNIGFTHGEGATFDTTAAQTDFSITVFGTGYAISANGTPLLSGALRDYSAFGLPYNQPKFLFFGDNTTSAAGRFEWSRASVVVVPEAGTLPMGLGAGCLVFGIRGFCRRMTRRS